MENTKKEAYIPVTVRIIVIRAADIITASLGFDMDEEDEFGSL